MKIRNFLIISGVAALATVNLMAGDLARAPRAADHQTKTIAGSNTDPNLTAANPVPASPRLLDNQIKTVSDTTSEAMSCAKHMAGTPKTIGVCAEHPGAAMPCCSGTASN